MRSFGSYREMTELALRPTLLGLGNMPPVLAESMLYSLEAGGKRLRPSLLLATCEALGGDVQQAMPFACALEMIHTYSLIHDDLPAMDNDDLRRGRPTNHKVFGDAMAILAGDGLLNAAAEVMLKAACTMPDLRGTRAAEAIMRRAGVTGMVGGQVLDVTQEGTEPTLEKVSYIHTHKTADLLTAPLEAGALLAGADRETIARCVDYGMHLGLAFQMVDDLLDVVGDAAVLGKNTGMDAQLGKLTWISVRGLEQTKADAAMHTAEACRAAAVFADNAEYFRDLANETLTRIQ